MSAKVLCVDIGGTNCSLGLVDANNYEILFLEVFPTKKITSFTAHILSYINKHRLKTVCACISAAGPIINDKVKLTNASLTIDKKEIIKKTQVTDVLLINDFEALAYSTRVLDKKDFIVLNKGAEKGFVTTVLGSGTGLGKGILYCNTDCFSLASEGGHTQFPITEDDSLLAKSIKQETASSHVTYEHVLSGRGIERIYRFLQKKHYHKDPPSLSAKEISLSLELSCSKRTMELFTHYFARCARNFALDTLSQKGVFLAGGIIAKNAKIIRDEFMKHFTHHDTHSKLLSEIPVILITNYSVSLKGACFAFIRGLKQ